MKAILSWLNFGAGLVLDLLALAAWFYGDFSRGLLLHFGALFFGGVAFFCAYPKAYLTHRWTSIALIAGFIGCTPILGLVFLAVTRLILTGTPVDDPSRKYFLGESGALTLIPFKSSTERAPQSVLEILNGVDNRARRKAILSLRAVEPKQALPVLKKAIQDSDEQVRLLAQSQFNRIVGGLELAIKSMEADLAKGDRSSPGLLRLAEHYNELVYLGISSEETEVIYLNRASRLLEEILRSEPAHTGASFLLLKCQIKSRDLSAAQETIKILKDRDFSDDFLAIWEAEIEYQQKDWRAFTSTLIKLASNPQADPRLLSVANIWIGTVKAE